MSSKSMCTPVTMVTTSFFMTLISDTGKFNSLIPVITNQGSVTKIHLNFVHCILCITYATSGQLSRLYASYPPLRTEGRGDTEHVTQSPEWAWWCAWPLDGGCAKGRYEILMQPCRPVTSPAVSSAPTTAFSQLSVGKAVTTPCADISNICSCGMHTSLLTHISSPLGDPAFVSL